MTISTALQSAYWRMTAITRCKRSRRTERPAGLPRW